MDRKGLGVTPCAGSGKRGRRGNVKMVKEKDRKGEVRWGKGDCELASDVAFPFLGFTSFIRRTPGSSRGRTPDSAVLETYQKRKLALLRMQRLIMLLVSGAACRCGRSDDQTMKGFSFQRERKIEKDIKSNVRVHVRVGGLSEVYKWMIKQRPRTGKGKVEKAQDYQCKHA